MNFRLNLGVLIIISILSFVKGEYTHGFNLNNIPKGLTMVYVFESMTQSPKYLVWSDKKKLKFLNSLIFLMKEVTQQQN
jgi:hypothetical protein